MKKIFYFCIVKTSVEWLKAAASTQRFLLPKLYLLDTERIMVCGSSNAHKVVTQQDLTAPWTLYLFNVIKC